jgi:hypothetical protein
METHWGGVYENDGKHGITWMKKICIDTVMEYGIMDEEDY